MPDETPKDVSVAEPVAPATPPQDASQEYVSRTELNAAVDRIIAEMAAQSKATRQSQKDVIASRVSREVGEKLASAFRPDPSPTPSPAPTAPPQAVEPAPSAAAGVETEIQAILTEAGLKGDEPELTAYLAEHKGQPWYSAGAGFAAVAQKISSRVGGSILAGEGTKSASPNDTQAYLDAVVALRGEVLKGLDRNQSRGQLAELKEKFRKKGVKVDQIGWGSAGSRTGQNHPDYPSNYQPT